MSQEAPQGRRVRGGAPAAQALCCGLRSGAMAAMGARLAGALGDPAPARGDSWRLLSRGPGSSQGGFGGAWAQGTGAHSGDLRPRFGASLPPTERLIISALSPGPQPCEGPLLPSRHLGPVPRAASPGGRNTPGCPVVWWPRGLVCVPAPSPPAARGRCPLTTDSLGHCPAWVSAHRSPRLLSTHVSGGSHRAYLILPRDTPGFLPETMPCTVTPGFPGPVTRL